jgi:recombination protein RecR
MPAQVNAIDRLVAAFSKLPGIGKKSASRLVYHVLDADPSFARNLARELSLLHDAIKRCSQCGSFTESDPCAICKDPARDRTLLCIVERAQDVRVIDESQEFRGLFHVLGGLIAPLEGVTPGDLSIAALPARIRKEGVREVILALNPTIEGDTTALYIQRFLKESLSQGNLATGNSNGENLATNLATRNANGENLATNLAIPQIEISRLASGLPVGGDLEYTDRLTLSRSLHGRIRM